MSQFVVKIVKYHLVVSETAQGTISFCTSYITDPTTAINSDLNWKRLEKVKITGITPRPLLLMCSLSNYLHNYLRYLHSFLKELSFKMKHLYVIHGNDIQVGRGNNLSLAIYCTIHILPVQNKLILMIKSQSKAPLTWRNLVWWDRKK